MKAYILAEIASAHLGSFAACRTLITDAKSVGADGVKLQIWTDSDIKDHVNYDNLKRFEMPPTDWGKLAAHAKAQGLDLWIEIYSAETLEFAKTLNPYAWKIRYNAYLKDSPSFEGIETPIFWRVMNEIPVYGNNVAIGEQGYPTSLAEAKHELELVKYYEATDRRILYADHQNAYTWKENTLPALAAYHSGADIIEKHICLNRKELAKDSRDHLSALEPREFKEFVEFMHANERGGKVRAIL